jgi:hypothetical protein
VVHGTNMSLQQTLRDTLIVVEATRQIKLYKVHREQNLVEDINIRYATVLSSSIFLAKTSIVSSLNFGLGEKTTEAKRKLTRCVLQFDKTKINTLPQKLNVKKAQVAA